MARMALWFLLSMGVGKVWSVRTVVQDPEAAQGSEVSPLGYAKGDTFGDFKLEDHLGNDALKLVDSSFLEETSSHNSTLGKNPLVSFPKNLKLGNFGDTQLLGAGSFGEAWLATGQPATPYAGQQVVVKLLYIKEGRAYKHVTRKMTSTNAILRREVAGAATECNFAMRLQKAAHPLSASEPDVAKLASRLMGCFEHNYKKATPNNDPIYLVLENCGKDDLHKYIKSNRGVFDVETLASITRQIAEGLYYLSRMTPPVIHHDLKPANVVVKTHASGLPTVHLIDFGGMMYGKQQNERKSGTVATYVYAPPEWGGNAFKMPASSFDMYALGNVLASAAIGEEFSSMYWSNSLQEPDYAKLKNIAAMSVDSFMTLFGPKAERRSTVGLAKMFEDPQAKQFIGDFWIKTIAASAAARPTPEALLSSPWLASATSPINAAWVMWKPPPPVQETKPDAPNVQINLDEDATAEDEEQSEGFQGCLHICDNCFPDSRPKASVKGRPAMECGIESENLKKYPTQLKWVMDKVHDKKMEPGLVFMNLGPSTEYCGKAYTSQMVGRNRHGRDDQQTYYVWKCGRVSEEEANAWQAANKL